MKQILPFRRAFAIVLFIGLFAMAARNVLDPDVWWHVSTGQWIAEHHAVPHSDPFSYTRAGQPWTTHEWLCELGLYKLFRLAGYAGLIISFAGIISAAFIPLYLRCNATPATAAAMTAWGALATTVVWGVRPQILSLLLFSIWLLILERSEKNPKLLWWTLPLSLLWVNVHASFILADVFLGLFIAGELIENVMVRAPVVFSRRLVTLSLTLLGSVVIIPLNPNGISVAWYPIQTLQVQRYITEWASPNFHDADYRALLLLFLAAVVTLAFSQRRVRARDLILLLTALAAALSSVRMIPFFVLIAVPLIAHSAGEWFSSGIRSPPRTQSLLFNVTIILLMLAFASVHTADVIRDQPRAEAAHFPTRASFYLRQHPPSGNILNHYDWGGYLIFELYPQVRVFVDGRTEVYGQKMMQEFLNTYYLQGCWQGVLSEWKITSVIVPPESALASALREREDWSLGYQDSMASVFMKSFQYSGLPSSPCDDGRIPSTKRAISALPISAY